MTQSTGAAEYTVHISASLNECPKYDTKQSDGEAPVMLELYAMWRTLSLPLLPGVLWSGVVTTDNWLVG